MKRSLSLGAGAIAAAVVVVAASSASAHINMVAPLVGRNGDEKSIPCDGAKGSGPVYNFEPGAIITLKVEEAIKHDSYFRIAFDNDGDDGFKEPASINPLNPNRVSEGFYGTAKQGMPRCLAEAADKCGQADLCNVVSTTGATVLWDYIDPHLGKDSAGTYTWTFQLPNVECENCTLQVLQVMEDPAFGAHGPFDGKGDIYHRCIDIKLKKGTGTAGPGNAPGAAIKVGDAPKKPVPEMTRNCLGAPVSGDAGVGSDAGAGSNAGTIDAGSSTDAGTAPGTGGAAGGPGSSASGTAAGGGATSGGGAAGGVVGGAADGGTAAGGTTGASGVAGGTAGTTATAGGVGVGGVAGGMPQTSDDDDGGCSVAFGNNSAGGAYLGVLVIAGLAMARRRRRA